MRAIGTVLADSLSTKSSLNAEQQMLPVLHERDLPPLYVPEVDRNLHSLVEFWEGGARVGAGTPMLRRPFTESEQSLLERRFWDLQRATAPWEHGQRESLLKVISGMLGSFPAMQRFDQHAAFSIANSYLTAARQQPHWAIIKAVEQVRSGTAGINPSYAPSEAEFLIVTTRLVEPYIAALKRAERLLEAKVQPPPPPKLTREELEAKLGRPLGGVRVAS
jgi:hypothetical protein